MSSRNIIQYQNERNDEIIRNADKPTKSKPVTFPCPLNSDILMKASFSKDSNRGSRVIVSLYDKEISKATVSHYGTDDKVLGRLAKTKYAEELYKKLPTPDEWHCIDIKDIKKDVTLMTLYAIHATSIVDALPKNCKDKKDILEALCSRLSQTSIDKLTVADCMDAKDDYVAKASLNSQADKDRLDNLCTELLKRLFDYCLITGYINTNPAKVMTLKKSDAVKLKGHMIAKSFSQNPEQTIYDFFSSNCEKDTRALGGIISYTAGLNLNEVCAIRFGDIKLLSEPNNNSLSNKMPALDAGHDYSLRISRVYSSVAGEYQITDLVERKEVFRVIPLSSQCMEHIIKRYIYLQKKYGPLEDISKLPIVCEYGNGAENIKKHYRPDYLAKYIRKTLKQMGVEQADLLIPSGNNGETGTLPLDVSANILRKHYWYRLKHTCGMSDGEQLYMIGRKCQDVDSRHYLDYLETYYQYVLKQKLERWKIRETIFSASESVTIPRDRVQIINCAYQWSTHVLPATDKRYATFVMDVEASEPRKPIYLDFTSLLGCNGTIYISVERSDEQAD